MIIYFMFLLITYSIGEPCNGTNGKTSLLKKVKRSPHQNNKNTIKNNTDLKKIFK